VKGYGKKDVKLFLREKVAPEVKKICDSVIVCLDRGFHFKPDEVEDELKAGGAGNIEDVWSFLPMVESLQSARQYFVALDEATSEKKCPKR
jgi:hypothetical protein